MTGIVGSLQRPLRAGLQWRCLFRQSWACKAASGFRRHALRVPARELEAWRPSRAGDGSQAFGSLVGWVDMGMCRLLWVSHAALFCVWRASTQAAVLPSDSSPLFDPPAVIQNSLARFARDADLASPHLARVKAGLTRCIASVLFAPIGGIC